MPLNIEVIALVRTREKVDIMITYLVYKSVQLTSN
jgi:hypothetical protein